MKKIVFCSTCDVEESGWHQPSVAGWIIWIILLASMAAADTCNKLSACACKNSVGVIDLTPLARNNGSARFTDINDGSGNYTISWNPCNPFKEDDCIDVAVCEILELFPTEETPFGLQESAKFVMSQDQVFLYYTYKSLKSTIALKCDQNIEANFVASPPAGRDQRNMTLTSKYACPIGKGEATYAISVGTFLCIIFLVTVSVYFIGGSLFQTCVKKATGKERLPHYDFWSTLPGYIKDGILVLFGGVNNKSAYENI